MTKISCGFRRSIRFPSRSMTYALRNLLQGSTPRAAFMPPDRPTERPAVCASTSSQTSLLSAVPCVNSCPILTARTTVSNKYLCPRTRVGIDGPIGAVSAPSISPPSRIPIRSTRITFSLKASHSAITFDASGRPDNIGVAVFELTNP